MHYLTAEEILIIHARIVDETGGLHGVRDTNLLGSLSERPKMQFGGKELYSDIFEKTAAYFESCAYHHIFSDGNKRTAIAIAARFLYLNDYELQIANELMECFILDAVEQKYKLEKIAAWFKKHSKKVKK